MKLPFIKIVLFFFVISIIPCQQAGAQKITGIWRGYFITDQNDQYKLEMQVAQNSSNRTTGVTYSYLSTIFYGKALTTGFFNKATKTALIQETKTVELKMSGGSIACIMKYQLTYSRSGKEEFLEGTYTSKYEKTNEGLAIKGGGDCGSGKVYLRKVITSDFYVEPFLRPQTKKATPPVIKPLNSAPPKKSVAPKTPEKVGTKSAPAPQVKSVPKTKTAPPAKQQNHQEINKTDTERKVVAPTISQKEATPLPMPPPIKMPAITRSRQNELVQTLVVKNKEIVVKLYDNGVVDGDTISIYLDNKLLLANKGLSTVPITFTVTLDEDGPEHTLVMVAENMGTIPPNTSLMIVHDGDKRYEVRITSTEQKNAMVRFRLQPDPK